MIEITDKIEFSETVHKAVDFFVTGKYPKKTEHIAWINNFLQSHKPPPKEDLLCEAWNKVGLDMKGKGQVTTPMMICDYMNKSTLKPTFKKNKGKPIHILDPACGSGVFAVSAYNLYHKHPQWKDCYFQQIDVDPIAARLTILNLMVRNFHAIVWEGDALIGNIEDYKLLNKKLPEAWYLHPQKKISHIHKLNEKKACKTWGIWFGGSYGSIKKHRMAQSSSPRKKENFKTSSNQNNKKSNSPDDERKNKKYKIAKKTSEILKQPDKRNKKNKT